MNAWLTTTWLRVLAILALIAAFLATDLLPYAYFQLMNWVVAGTALTLVHQAYVMKKSAMVWLFAAIAVVFNPLAPLYFRQDVWRIADVVVAGIFLVTFFFGRTRVAGRKK